MATRLHILNAKENQGVTCEWLSAYIPEHGNMHIVYKKLLRGDKREKKFIYNIHVSDPSGKVYASSYITQQKIAKKVFSMTKSMSKNLSLSELCEWLWSLDKNKTWKISLSACNSFSSLT